VLALSTEGAMESRFRLTIDNGTHAHLQLIDMVSRAVIDMAMRFGWGKTSDARRRDKRASSSAVFDSIFRRATF
jgi:hypothetical protein